VEEGACRHHHIGKAAHIHSGGALKGRISSVDTRRVSPLPSLARLALLSRSDKAHDAVRLVVLPETIYLN
jgi:hypothetical protein